MSTSKCSRVSVDVNLNLNNSFFFGYDDDTKTSRVVSSITRDIDGVSLDHGHKSGISNTSRYQSKDHPPKGFRPRNDSRKSRYFSTDTTPMTCSEVTRFSRPSLTRVLRSRNLVVQKLNHFLHKNKSRETLTEGIY